MSLRNALRAAALAAFLLLSIPGHAQLFRTYLASTGSDSNPCTLAAPCRLLPAALTAVADGGEIWMLDSANYNAATVNITKSVTVLAIPGAVGSVVVANGAPAISIATANVKVSLRNLLIARVAGSSPADGIVMSNGARLAVQGCVIANTGAGIVVQAQAAILIADTIVRDTTNTGILLRNGARASIVRSILTGNELDGVSAHGSVASTTTVDISDSTLEGNGAAGLFAQSTLATAVVKVTVSDSRVERNEFNGAELEGVLGPVTVAIARSSLSNNQGSGLHLTGANARATLSASVVSHNIRGLAQLTGSTLETAGNNSVRNNTDPNVGTITNVGTQ